MTFLVQECYGSPKISIKFVKIRQNLLKFTPEECYDKVLNEKILRILFCKMKNVITRISTIQVNAPHKGRNITKMIFQNIETFKDKTIRPIIWFTM
jgi:hypothetical protein